MFNFKEKAVGIKPLFIRVLVLGFFGLLKILGTTSIDECIDANPQKIDAGNLHRAPSSMLVPREADTLPSSWKLN